MQKMASIIVLCFSLCVLQVAYAEQTSPEGYWKTIDDVTNEAKSILQITKTENDTLIGKIVKIYPDPGRSENEVCIKCHGARHNQPIVGMVIMEHLKHDKDNANEWNGGEILDPRSGKIYHFMLRVIDNGKKISARGYIGVPLFGRTQEWLRVSGPQG